MRQTIWMVCIGASVVCFVAMTVSFWLAAFSRPAGVRVMAPFSSRFLTAAGLAHRRRCVWLWAAGTLLFMAGAFCQSGAGEPG